MPRCADIIDRVRILSSCDKPVYSQICNVGELATAIGVASDNSALLTEIRDAVKNNTAVLKAELDELDLSIHGVVSTLDAGIKVTATQAGTWTVDTTGTNVTADEIAAALDSLNVVINGQVAPLKVNIETQPITVTVANPTDLSATNALLNNIQNAVNAQLDTELLFTGRVVHNAAGTPFSALQEVIQTAVNPDGSTNRLVKRIVNLNTPTLSSFTLASGQTLDFPKTPSTHANRYAEHTTTQTVTGTNIVVSFIEGAGSFTLAGNTVTLDSAKHYKTEPMDGSVTITPNAGAKYHVSWRQV